MSTSTYLTTSVNIPHAIRFSFVPNSVEAGSLQSEPFILTLSAYDTNDHIIDLYSKGSNSKVYQIPQNKWSHLSPQWRFIDLSGNYIDKVKTTDTVVYSGAEILGVTGVASFYYIDNLGGDVSLYATLQVSGMPITTDQQNNTTTLPSHANSMVFTTTGYTITSVIPTKLNITKNGIEPLSTTTYWINQTIPFLITIGSNDNMLYNYPSSNQLGIDMGYVNLTLDNTPLSTQIWKSLDTNEPLMYFQNTDDNNNNIAGYIKGTFKSSVSTLNAIITAGVNVNYGSGVVYLTGQSSSFNIENILNYDLRKFNESHDITKQMRSYALPEFLYNNYNLFENYLGTMVGGLETSANSIGKCIYERIANYVENHADVDTCNIDQLYSIAKELDVSIDNHNTDMPSELKRIIDLVSISHKKLWGDRCKCNHNFKDAYSLCDNCGHPHNTNRGNTINTDSYMVSSNIPYLAEYKFQRNYYEVITPININNTLILNHASAYLINDPEDYCFYNYLSNYCDVQNEGVVSWDSEFTTVDENLSSLNLWYDQNGIVEKMLNYYIHNGLGF